MTALAMGLAVASLPAGSATARIESSAAAGDARVIVKYRAGSALMRAQVASPRHAQALSARLGIDLTDGRSIGAQAQVVKGRGMTSSELAARLTAQADVEYAVVDGRKRRLSVPNDPLYPTGQVAPTTPAVGQWYLRPPTGVFVSAIDAQTAWNTGTGSGIVVAALDTGVRRDHPDLTSKLLAGYDLIFDTATANDGDGRDADASDPGDFVTQDDTTNGAGCSQSDVGEPSSWHGTQTAGLIGAATNNGIGMAGTARDSMVLPVRVLGKCGGFDSDILAGMLWAAGLSNVPVANPNPARVLNLSLGSAGACSLAFGDTVRQLNDAGVVVVVAAGNDGLEVNTPGNCPGVVAVAGVRHTGTKVGYSSLGPEAALAAPAGNCGVDLTTCQFPLLTTSNSGTTTPVAASSGGAIYTNGGADRTLGTSFSTPLVAGTAALMLSVNTSLKPSQVARALKATAHAFPSSGAGVGVSACTAPSSTAQSAECYCTTSTCGAGLLNAAGAVASPTLIAAGISTESTNVVAGTPVALDGAAASGGSGNGALTYAWTITSGGNLASITSAANASNIALAPTAEGVVVVQLTVTDGSGSDATSVTLNVSPAPPKTTTPEPPVVAPTTGDSGGGGAMQPAWLLAWLAAIFAVGAVTPRRRHL